MEMPHVARPVHELKANLFRVLGHPARVRTLELLRHGERSVGALAVAVPATCRLGLLAQAAGVALLGAAGLWILAAQTSIGRPFTSALDVGFGVDGLTAFFLGTLGLVGAPVLFFATRYLQPTRRGRATAVLLGAFLLTLAEVLCARDPLTFLAGWE